MSNMFIAFLIAVFIVSGLYPTIGLMIMIASATVAIISAFASSWIRIQRRKP